MSEPPAKVVEAPPDEKGAKDSVAPVQGAKLRSADVGELLSQMSKKERQKAAKRLVDAHPDLRKVRRERVRVLITVILVAAVFIDGAVALGLAIANTISWEELKDWLTLALVPLTPGVAVALAFWFPTKETE